MLLLNGLDEEQNKAALHVDGPAITISGPGSGKTRVVTSRVANLIGIGIDPDKILCVTFSKAAATEMRRRISDVAKIPQYKLKKNVCTFHSLAYRIVREDGPTYGWHMKMVASESQIKGMIRRRTKDKILQAHALEFLKKMHSELITPSQAVKLDSSDTHAQLCDIYESVHDQMREEGIIDFDTMIYLANKILDFPASGKKWQDKFEYIIIDETHDTDKSQQRLVSLLAQPNDNIFVVGDPNQSIYGFRGADASVLFDFPTEHPSCAQFYLARNYRSHKEIVDVFKPLASSEGLAGTLAERMYSVKGGGGIVSFNGHSTEPEEATFVSEEIKNLIYRGARPEKIAVLARTRAVLSNYAEALELNKIPYQWMFKGFWESREVEDVMAFLRLIKNPKDTKAFTKALVSTCSATRFLGWKFAKAVCDEADEDNGVLGVIAPRGFKSGQYEQWTKFREKMVDLSRKRQRKPQELLIELFDSLGFWNLDIETEEPDEFLEETYEKLVERVARFSSIQELFDYLEGRKAAKKKKVGVILSTMHGSKGLEWDVVFCSGVTDGIVPHKRAESQDEEARVFYVGLSRAINKLYVTWYGAESRFIKLIRNVVDK